MGQNVREQVNDIFASLKKGETFSPEMTELIKKELERVSKEAIEYNKKKREGQTSRVFVTRTNKRIWK